MQPIRFTEQFKTLLGVARQMTESAESEAILLLLEGRARCVAAENPDRQGEGRGRLEYGGRACRAKEAGLETIRLDMPDSPVYERPTRSLSRPWPTTFSRPVRRGGPLQRFRRRHRRFVERHQLDEHLDRLPGRDLRQLETRVPLDTLKIVVDLAVEIGREGREGKPVGTLFVVGDSRKVMASSRPTAFDPVRGYSRKERNLDDARIRRGDQGDRADRRRHRRLVRRRRKARPPARCLLRTRKATP